MLTSKTRALEINQLEKPQQTALERRLLLGHFQNRWKKIVTAFSPEGDVAKRAQKKTVLRRIQPQIQISNNLLAGAMSHKKKRKKPKKTVFLADQRRETNWGTIYIQSTHNNTIYTLTNKWGCARSWVSAGTCGFKNTRKSTSYASQAAAGKIARAAKDLNIACVHIKMSGLGAGKLSGVRTLHQSGFRVTKIRECTPLPHNGCRPAKSRRV